MSNDKVWDTISAQEAERLGEHLFEAHRGVIDADESPYRGVAFAFGNDGFDDPRTQCEVEAARRYIVQEGGTILGFGVCTDGYSWVLAFRAASNVSEKLLEVMWTAWQGQDSTTPFSVAFREVQSSIAEAAIYEYLSAAPPHDVIHPN